MTFFTADDKGYLLKIKLTPNSAQNGFKGVFCDEKGNVFLKGTVTVVPEKGKANKELIALLAKALKISAQQSLKPCKASVCKKPFATAPPCKMKINNALFMIKP